VRKTLLLVVTVVALLTTGCIQADLKLDVNDDGSGTYSAIIAVNSKLLETMGGLAALDPDADTSNTTGDICKDMLTDAQEDTPEGSKVEPYKKGDFCGVKLTASFANIDEGLELLNSSSDTGGATLENVTLEKQGAAWVFDAEWNPGDTNEATGGDAEMAKQFLQGFSFVIRMKLPGGQVDQNADLIEDDGTMVWNLDPSASRDLKARTEPGAAVIKGKVQTDAGKNVNQTAAAGSGASDDGGSKTWIIIVIGLVVVAIIVAIVLMKRNKPKAVPAMAGMPMGSPMSSPMSAPSAPSAPTATAAAPAATAAATEPQWDAARNAYIQWDNVNNRWMQYDQAAATWKPIE
jgi:hypothetical protein